jgi:hypothetical protein
MSQAMEGNDPGQPRRNTSQFPHDFFAALNKSDDDTAMMCLRAEAIPDGVPSPRAADLIKTGAWDSLQKLSLVYVDVDACSGCVGTDGLRFCGKARNFCKVQSHPKSSIGKVKRGWYIACLGKSAGVFTTPFLPAQEDGGPIRSQGAVRLLDEDNPFRLTRGQWQFVIDY